MPLRVRACRLDEVVPEQLRAFAVTGATWPVIVTYSQGELVAFPGVCPHDDVPLEEYGVLSEGTLQCRVHGYRFDVVSGKCEHMPALRLRRYKITLVDDEVWVDLM
jgi:nitrite reductase/ring-hydroxylating ferredoxin subunit